MLLTVIILLTSNKIAKKSKKKKTLKTLDSNLNPVKENNYTYLSSFLTFSLSCYLFSEKSVILSVFFLFPILPFDAITIFGPS